MNFNDFFGGNVTHDYLKSNKKTGLHLLSRTFARFFIVKRVEQMFNMFTAKGLSEATLFMHLSKHIFRSQ